MKKIEPGTRFHMHVSVNGALKNKAFVGFSDAAGNIMTKKQAEAHLTIMQMKGIKYVRDGDCDNFDPNEGCLGHPIDTEAGE
jgi:hypothetical protein